MPHNVMESYQGERQNEGNECAQCLNRSAWRAGAAETGTLFRRLPLVLKQWCYTSLFARLSDDNVIFGYCYPIFVMVERLRNNDDAASRLSVVKRVGAIVN